MILWVGLNASCRAISRVQTEQAPQQAYVNNRAVARCESLRGVHETDDGIDLPYEVHLGFEHL